MAIVASLVALALGVGAANGVGPLARVTPASEVADQREMLARSLQAVIDASSVRVEVALAGTAPGEAVGRAGGAVALDGARAVIDLRPQDARSHAVAGGGPLGAPVEAVTSWDTLAYRVGDGPWTRGSLGGVASGTGLDLNPLTLVGRLRDWLARPGAPAVTSAEVPCGAPSGRCHRVEVALGPEAVRALLEVALGPEAVHALLGALPGAASGGASAAVGEPPARLVLLTDAETLRPVRLDVEGRSADGTVAVSLRAEFTLWDLPSVIPDPPAG